METLIDTCSLIFCHNTAPPQALQSHEPSVANTHLLFLIFMSFFTASWTFDLKELRFLVPLKLSYSAWICLATKSRQWNAVLPA